MSTVRALINASTHDVSVMMDQFNELLAVDPAAPALTAAARQHRGEADR